VSDKGIAQTLYPGLPSAADAPAAKPEPETSPAAKALYGNPPDNRLKDGVSSLGGQAKPATLLGGDPAAARTLAPFNGEAKPPEAKAPEVFNPEMVRVPENVTVDPALMGEFATAAKDLGLGQEGAQRLLDLHARAQEAEATRWEQTSAQWQAETVSSMSTREIQSATSLLRDLRLTDPQVREWLESSPGGNWLPLVRTLARYAEAIDRGRRGY
jgi:hypothetical protein